MLDKLKIEYISIDEIKPYPNNAKLHPAEQIEQIKESIKEFGFNDPIAIDKENEIIEGHGRYIACKELGIKELPIIRLDNLTDEQKRAYMLVHNKLTMNTDFDIEILNDELESILDIDMSKYDFDTEDDITEKYTETTPNSLRQKFIVPPFSVLDARNGEWQKRKRAWYKIISSEKGRSDTLISKAMLELAKVTGAESISGSSIFDPVLTEVLLNWFSPRKAKILDPFAGGSVRGIVSSYLDRYYYGNDIRPEQIEANEENFKELEKENNFFNERLTKPVWTIGDSVEIDKLIDGNDFDLLFTCPPYADLETYSDLPGDISNMEYEDFLKAYKTILKKSADKLKDNAFACVVVGEIRDKNGIYRNFINDTIEAMQEAGLKYYNEIILVTMVGTLSLRARQPFEATRKVGNTHQKALIFYKERTDESLKDFIETFEKNRQLAPMKKSVLVFLKGNSKLAKTEIEKYDFELF